MNKRVWAIVAIVAVAGVLLLLRSSLFGPSDRQLIREAVEQSAQASREGRPGGVLEYLSKSLTFNDIPAESRAEIAKFISQSKPEVEIRNPEPVISGNTAEIVTPVQVKFSYLAFSFDQEIPNVRIVLQKEAGTKWLIVPTKKWRIVSITAPEISASEFMSN
jgi:hypothetical protein